MRPIAWAALAGAVSLWGCVTPTTEAPVVGTSEISAEAQKQAELAVTIRRDQRARVAQVAARLFNANVDLCPETRRSLGFASEVIEDYPKSFRPTAAGVMGLTSRPQVGWVAEGGPSATAGLKSGDQLVSIDGRAIREGASGQDDVDQALAGPGTAPLKVAYRRNGVEQTVEMIPIRACGYRVLVSEDDALNAAADGKRIMITRGLLRFVKSDEELALVMAHELAHDTERHLRAKSTNATLGLLGGAVFDVGLAALGVNTQGAFMKAGQAAGAGYASAAFESEADYVGMYYMARAGYDTSKVDDFWRRMSVEEPKAIFITSSHPANPQRYLAIGKAREEIAGKQAQHLALLPERRAGKKVSTGAETAGSATALKAAGS